MPTETLQPKNENKDDSGDDGAQDFYNPDGGAENDSQKFDLPASEEDAVYKTAGNEASDAKGERLDASDDKKGGQPLDREALNQKEEDTNDGPDSKINSGSGTPGSFYAGAGDKEDPGFMRSMRQNLFVKNRRKTIAGGGLLGVIISLIFAFSFFQGPLQFVHFAQLLQRFHFAHNEDFSDYRTMKIIINGINGKNNQSRLGRVANRYADKWEKQLVKDTGLKPVYTKGLNRFAGFQVVNGDLAGDYLSDFESDGINTRGSPAALVDKDGKAVGSSGRIVDMRDEKALAKRSLVRSVGKATDTTKVISAIGSRLLIKRGGIDFHPLKNIARKAADSLTDYRKRVLNQEANEDRTGKILPDKTQAGAQDDKGNTDPKDIDASTSANEVLNEAEAAGAAEADGASLLKDLQSKFLAKSAGPALIIGVLCSVKALGDHIPDYQYQNVILPEMRKGARIISTGSQVQSGQDVNLDELGAVSSTFTDPSDNTSWVDARSIQAELGQPQTGPDIPTSAKPDKLGDKPQIFDILDQLPFLGTTCFVANITSHIPLIKNVISWSSDQLFSAMNTIVASTAGSAYTPQSLMDDALRVAAGMSVNLYAQGAELGNIANYGSRLAANDQALSTGGRALTSAEIAQLDQLQSQDIAYQTQHTPILKRLFNPYDTDSAVAKAIDYTPAPSQYASVLGDLPSKITSSMGAMLKLPFRKASAAQSYNYGFPEYGFSQAEQDNSEFDNPDENAAIVEPQLDQLNSKYGDCFSMNVEPDPSSADGIILSTGDSVNYYDVAQKNPQCNDGSEALLRYRFYLADAVTTASLSCYEGDENYCSQLGFGTSADISASSGSPVAPSGAALPSGSATDLAAQLKQYVDNGKIKCTTAGCPDIINTAGGKSIHSGSCKVDALSPGLLGMLLVLVQMGHTFTLSALCSDHQTVDGPSGHNGGRAADFNTIDGVFIGPNDVAWTAAKAQAGSKLDQDIASFMPKSTGFGQINCHSTFSFLIGFDTFPDACHHQHVQVEV
jgi:hypothetical protein